MKIVKEKVHKKALDVLLERQKEMKRGNTLIMKIGWYYKTI